MTEAFDREFTLAELLPAAMLETFGTAAASLLDADFAILDAAGTPLWGRAAGDAPREALVLELEPVAHLAAAVPRDRLRAAAVLLRQVLSARARYLMTCDLHTDAIAADWQTLLERNQALAESEARYKALSEELEQRVEAQVALLDERQRQLYQAEKLASVGQLAAGMAHEINNPIGFVRSNIASFGGYIDKLRALKGRLGDAPAAWKELDLDFVLEDGADIVKDSLEGIDRVARIVRDLKGFSNVDKPEEEVVDINDGLREACSVFAGQLPPGVALEQNLGALPRILCLPGHLNQVFLHLIENAVQAVADSGKPGTVTVSSRPAEGGVGIAIADTGVGMSAAQQARVFEPFYTTRPVGKGTGLGLTVVRDVVQAHGGKVALDSRPGAGTTVTIFLPA
ncbi:MAG: HAMP domain-containing histidine kinase [Candidatus Nitricoxidivorans perseverans]|uniref:histidine kinase n=1 Tax=Candidatus Nitricoxidivorans perseverans TaxID=2975601 RepID=A0AA49FLI4_9PROT|nr:MAG: HAMP domain-containing histidine kinase [Candidatus Nitricoxidivorans perseverans]